MSDKFFWETMTTYCNRVVECLQLTDHVYKEEDIYLINFKKAFEIVEQQCLTYGYDIFKFCTQFPHQMRYMVECAIRLQLAIDYGSLVENSPYVSLKKDTTAMLAQDCEEVRKRDESYGSSWKKRGGIGAFMMTARKFDRIMQNTPNNSLSELRNHVGDEGVSDTIANDLKDFRRYLLLIETEIAVRTLTMV